MLNAIQTNAGLSLLWVNTKPSTIIVLFLPYLFGISGIILIFMIVSAGFKLMTSKGDPKATQLAQAKITTSLIGIIIIALSFFAVNLVLKFFNLDTNINIIG